jgi:hemerythrin
LKHFIWQAEKYSVGDQRIDRQHQQVLEIINRLIDHANQGNNDPLLLTELLLELNEYASSHFHTEESLLQRIGYPQLDEQRSSHDRYTATISGFMVKLDRGLVDLQKLLEFIHDWWENHILTEDMAFKSYISS